MAETLDERLVRKGEDANLVGLRQQYPVSVQHARDFAAELEEVGWLPAQTDALEQDGKTLESKDAAKHEKRRGAKRKTKTEAKKRQEAKKYIRRLRNAVPSVLKHWEGEAPVSAEDFEVGGTLGSSTPLITAYLTKVRPSVEKIDEPLKRYFNKQSALAELDKVYAELTAADTEQEVSRATLPLDTQAFYETKGRVLDAIEELNRLAKNAFDGDARKIGLFNKDLLLRATKENLQPEDGEDDEERPTGS